MRLVNHGIFPSEDVNLVDMGLEQWKRTLDVNLTGKMLALRFSDVIIEST